MVLKYDFKLHHTVINTNVMPFNNEIGEVDTNKTVWKEEVSCLEPTNSFQRDFRQNSILKRLDNNASSVFFYVKLLSRIFILVCYWADIWKIVGRRVFCILYISLQAPFCCP